MVEASRAVAMKKSSFAGNFFFFSCIFDYFVVNLQRKKILYYVNTYCYVLTNRITLCS
jgi:hypothetical protein